MSAATGNEDDRETVAVTPPGMNTPSFRTWAEQQAKGHWLDLRWNEEIDRHGFPMGRLTGVRSTPCARCKKEPNDCECTGGWLDPDSREEPER